MPWIVAQDAGQVIGYAYASEWMRRSAYRFSVESTVYLDCSRIRKGVGSHLYEAFFSNRKPAPETSATPVTNAAFGAPRIRIRKSHVQTHTAKINGGRTCTNATVAPHATSPLRDTNPNHIPTRQSANVSSARFIAIKTGSNKKPVAPELCAQTGKWLFQ